MKKLFAIVGLLLTSTFCSAADLQTKATGRVSVADPSVIWTGGYIGAVFGYGWKDQTTAISGNDATAKSLIAAGVVPSSVNLRPSGAMLGGVIGYDYQFAPRLIGGVAVDWSWANLRDSNTALGNLVNRSVDEKISSFGTIRGRLGYLLTDRAMLYATGGGAWANIRTNVTSAGTVCGGGFIACGTGASDNTKWGWVVGGGLEYRLDRNWSLTGEALWADLGTQNTIINARIGRTPISYTQSQDVKIGVVRAGLNYRF